MKWEMEEQTAQGESR